MIVYRLLQVFNIPRQHQRFKIKETTCVSDRPLTIKSGCSALNSKAEYTPVVTATQAILADLAALTPNNEHRVNVTKSAKKSPPTGWKKFRLLDDTPRVLPAWADKPLHFAGSPDAALKRGAFANPPKVPGFEKSVRAKSNARRQTPNPLPSASAAVHFRHRDNPKKVFLVRGAVAARISSCQHCFALCLPRSRRCSCCHQSAQPKRLRRLRCFTPTPQGNGRRRCPLATAGSAR